MDFNPEKTFIFLDSKYIGNILLTFYQIKDTCIQMFADFRNI